MRCFVGFYTTKRTFYIRSYLRGHWSITPSVLKLTTSPSFAKLVTWMNVTLLSGLFTRIVIDYSSTSVHFIYLRMFHCIHVCILWNCNHLRFVMWLNKEIWWWWLMLTNFSCSTGSSQKSVRHCKVCHLSMFSPAISTLPLGQSSANVLRSQFRDFRLRGRQLSSWTSSDPCCCSS